MSNSFHSLHDEVRILREALQFYASGIHSFIDPDNNEWVHVAPYNGAVAENALKATTPVIAEVEAPTSRRQIITVSAPVEYSHEGHEPDCNYPDAFCICENPPLGTCHQVTVILRDEDDA